MLSASATTLCERRSPEHRPQLVRSMQRSPSTAGPEEHTVSPAECCHSRSSTCRLKLSAQPSRSLSLMSPSAMVYAIRWTCVGSNHSLSRATTAGRDAHRRCSTQGTAAWWLVSTHALDARWKAASAANKQEKSTSTGQRAPVQTMIKLSATNLEVSHSLYSRSHAQVTSRAELKSIPEITA